MQEQHNVGVKTGLLPQGQVRVEPTGVGCLVTRHSIFTQRENSMELPVSADRVRDYYAGGKGMIQDLFPELTADQREFLMTGCTPEEWDSIFGGDEDDD